MKYGLFFLILAAACGWYGYLLGGWGWLLLWPSLSFAAVAAAYLGLGPAVLGKRLDGTIGLVPLVGLLPFFLYTWSVWHLSRLLRREACCNEVYAGLYLGRRALARELPPGVTNVVDLTAEFVEPEAVRHDRRYICVPTLDASMPPDGELKTLVEKVIQLSGATYIHCAEGHGRSAALVCALLLAKGMAKDVDEASRLVRKSRPRARLNAIQRGSLLRLMRDFLVMA